MSDFLLDVAQNPRARKLIRSLGLPIPLPEKLRRDDGPWTAMPLRDQTVVVGAAAGAEWLAPLAGCLAAAGANPFLEGSELSAPFARLVTSIFTTSTRPSRRRCSAS